MPSKFERDLLLPAFSFVEHARRLEQHYGTSFNLGFELSGGDQTFAAMVASCFGLGRSDAGIGEVSPLLGNLIHALLRWYDGGCPRFRLTHGLVTQLALTDPQGVPMEEVQQPFPTYVVELPSPNGPVVWDVDGRMREPAYIVVHRASHNEATGELLISSRDSFSKLAKQRELPQRSVLHVHVTDGANSSMFLSRGICDDADTVDISDLAWSSGTEAPPRDHDDSCIALCTRIAFNLPLYLRHRPSDRTSGGKTVNHDHGMRSTLYELGADVPLNRNLRDAARASCNQRDREPWKLATRFIVRGHWKRQVHGPGRTERKMIFVQPYWKGDADSPLVARAHVDRGA
jgi:hypothetical protein